MNIKFYILQESEDKVHWCDFYRGELYFCKNMLAILSRKNRSYYYRIVRLCP